MKLYYSPGSCSLASHIVLREADLPHELIRVDIKHDKTTADGRNFNSINPKGYVPALELDNGIVLSEGAAIMQFLAEQRPQSGLLPPAGSVERAQVQGWLNFVASELHKSFSPLFNKQASDDWRAAGAEHLRRRLAYVSESLGDKPYLMGGRLCIARARAAEFIANLSISRN